MSTNASSTSVPIMSAKSLSSNDLTSINITPTHQNDQQQEPITTTTPSPRTHLIAGASAGLISAITLQPFDLLKTRLQQQQLQHIRYRTSISKELKKLTKVKDLWRGALPSTLRTSIGAGLYFTILSQLRSFIASQKYHRLDTDDEIIASETSALPKLSPMENLATGFVVRAVVGFVTMPITIIKTRYESNIYNYNSMYEGFENIYRGTSLTNSTTDPNTNPTSLPRPGGGSITNFFKGSLATLARDCPYAGLYVLFYESFKNDLMPRLMEPLEPTVGLDHHHGHGHNHEEQDWSDWTRSTVINTGAAVLAALVSTTMTAPFDAIKTRVQLTSSSPSSPKTIWGTTKTLLREEGGVRNLFRGLLLRFGRKGMSAGISWCIYEELIKSQRLGELIGTKERLA